MSVLFHLYSFLFVALLRNSAVSIRSHSPSFLAVEETTRPRSSSSPAFVLEDMAGSTMDSATAMASINNAVIMKQGWLQKRGRFVRLGG